MTLCIVFNLFFSKINFFSKIFFKKSYENEKWGRVGAFWDHKFFSVKKVY